MNNEVLDCEHFYKYIHQILQPLKALNSWNDYLSNMVKEQIPILASLKMINP